MENFAIDSDSAAQPVDSELRAQLADPLIEAVRQTLLEMAGVDVGVFVIYQREAPAEFADISAVLTLSLEFEGALILSLTNQSAQALARRILGPNAAEAPPALINDCVGEVANVIAGQAKALLAGTPNHFVFGTPVVSASRGMGLYLDMHSLVIVFDSDVGRFVLQMCRRARA